jgi:hypothetical protein
MGNVFAVEVEVLVAPSLKVHKRVKVSPAFGSEDPADEKLQARPVQLGSLITGTGGRLPGGSVMATVLVVVEVSPYSSRAVSVTV